MKVLFVSEELKGELDENKAALVFLYREMMV